MKDALEAETLKARLRGELAPTTLANCAVDSSTPELSTAPSPVLDLEPALPIVTPSSSFLDGNGDDDGPDALSAVRLPTMSLANVPMPPLTALRCDHQLFEQTELQAPTPAEPALFVRSMPLPKHFTASTAAPKTTLQGAAVKLDRFCLIDYVTLSNSFRAARVMLKIRWSDRREQAWTMQDLGCSSLAEAESYVATLALHDIIAIEGKGDKSVWRSFPPAFRDLWDELEEKRKGLLDKERRAVWATLRAIVEARYPPDTPAEPVLVPESAAKVDSKLIPGFDFLPPPPKDGEADIVDPVSLQLQQEFARRQATPAYQRMLVRCRSHSLCLLHPADQDLSSRHARSNNVRRCPSRPTERRSRHHSRHRRSSS